MLYYTRKKEGGLKMNFYDVENMADYLEEIAEMWEEVHAEEEEAE